MFAVGASVSASGAGFEAFVWTPAGGLVALGDLPGGSFHSEAWSVTPNGDTIVGMATSAAGPEAFRWTAATGMAGLGDLPGGAFESFGLDVSDDGSVVTGWSTSANGPEAFRWTAATGMVALGAIPGGSYPVRGLALSGDGRVVVGSGDRGGVGTAFVWDAEHGMRALEDVLESDLGIDVAGWRLHEARGISRDGSRIVGVGFDPSSQLEAFLAVIPACVNGRDDDGDGFVDADGGGFGPPDPQCVGAPSRVSEAPQPAGCGLGPELAPGLLLLLRRSSALGRRAPTPPLVA